jgi:hypothetical protein
MKRKVTDLKPNEAILISSYADLKVMEEFEKAGIVWVNGGEKPTQWKPFPSWEFPDRIVLDNGRISRGSPHRYIELPATDFIPTEAEKVEGSVVIEADNSIQITINPVYERQLLIDYHNFILDDPRAKECDVVGESVLLFLKTRNPETK